MPVSKPSESRGDSVSLFFGLQALLKTPFFLPITIAVLSIGAADAVGGSYMTLFAVDQGRMNPLELGIFLSALTTHELRGTKADVGLIFSVCAFLEVLVMFTFVIQPSKAGSRRWISFGFLAFLLYFLVATWSPSVAVLLGAQVFRAVGIGLIGYQGISYIQALMPNQIGTAAALFSNTTNAGFLLSGLTAGAWAQAFGYRSMFIVCAVLSGLGLLLLHFQPKGRCT